MNGLLIICDALRYDHFNSQYMPHLSKLSTVGVKFNLCFSIGGNTIKSLPGIFSSQKTYDKKRNFPTILRDHGYSTAMIHSTPMVSEFRHGFTDREHKKSNLSILRKLKRRIKRKRALRPLVSQIRNLIQEPMKSADLPYLRAEKHLQKTEIKMQELNNPWFIWTHLMDPHLPYSPLDKTGFTQEEVRTLNDKILNSIYKSYQITEREHEKIKELYRREVGYMDACLGKFLVNLFKTHPKTLVIVTSDHGDEFGEYGHYSHSPGPHGPIPQLLHVPLIIFKLGIQPKTINEYVSHLDIAPTILDYAGVGEKIGYGNSLKRHLE